MSLFLPIQFILYVIQVTKLNSGKFFVSAQITFSGVNKSEKTIQCGKPPDKHRFQKILFVRVP